MKSDYGNQRDYLDNVKQDADFRQKAIENALHDAFLSYIESREIEVIIFSNISAIDLASAILKQPIILKPLIAACNIAARAIERDLSIINLNTYSPKLDNDQANLIAGYIKPFLPEFIEIPSLCQVDKIAYIDKEMRRKKGNWEKKVLNALNNHSSKVFKKCKFDSSGQKFELDAAFPQKASFEIGIDIKRIEARKDIHKRCDEIVNKGSKFKDAFPNAKFGVVIYYPFIDEHINVENRLKSANIDAVVFAAESLQSIENSVGFLLSSLEAGKK
jgi:hypothetical protein